jgi:tellurite resistance protein
VSDRPEPFPALARKEGRLRHQGEHGLERSHPSWTLLWAVNAAAAIVARADGRVDPAERRQLSAYLRRCEIEGLKSPLAHGLFDKCLRELERDPAGERGVLARVLAGFVGTPWAWVILRAAEQVATADGGVHEAEARMLESIRTALDLPPGVPERYAARVLWRGRA